MPAGRHRIFLGMAAGVGKTYRALAELRQLSDDGADAVVAYLEPHGRAETVAQAEGMEMLPRRFVARGTAEIPELDLPAVLRRAPQVCLVDELAHTNAPGLEHSKRHHDVEELLAAGIDVLSTVNVQHLESLNDLVAQITGVRVAETLPDHVLAHADEVVIVDLSPQELLGRLRAGKVYAPDRVQTALNGFFKFEHLDALRELALRQVAEGVEARRLERPPDTRRDDAFSDATLVGERMLALVDADSDGEAVVRRAARSAQRLIAPLHVLAIVAPRPPTADEQARIDHLAKLCRQLGCELITRQADDVLAVTVDVARQLGTTYLLMATTGARRGAARFRPSLLDRLLDALPHVDVRVVRDRAPHC